MTNKVFALHALGVLVVSFLLLGFSSIFSDQNSIVLSKYNTVIFSDEVNGDSVSSAIKNARELEAKFSSSKGFTLIREPIYLFMNTPGGSVQSGMELIEALNGLNYPIDTISLFSVSMGFQIVQNLGERYILKSGVLMSHRASGEFAGSFGGQKPSPLDNRFNLWYTRMQEFDAQTVKRTNGKQTMESYQKAYSDELWLTGQQAVDGGYADKIVTVKCDDTLTGTTKYSEEFLGMKVEYELDNCPLNTTPTAVKAKAKLMHFFVTDKELKDVESKFVEHYNLKFRTVIPATW